jgi:type II secretory pathway pseudopilin PulG
MTKTEPRVMAAAGDHGGEAGFTLVEALTAMVILIFGLMAVTNLLIVAASSNSVASQSTAATLSASQRLEVLKSTSFQNLAAGGSLTADTTGPPANPCAVAPLTDYDCDDVIPGVGLIHTRWQISAIAGTARLLYITVRSEGTGALSGARSRAQFTTLRSCTDSSPTGGCPLPP